MRTRAIQDLSCLTDEEFFVEVAEGLSLVADNALQVNHDARTLVETKRRRGARVLTVIAEEEAAKFLILLDAVRCPKDPQGRLSMHLRKYYSHLAKGIYAAYCWRRPWNFADVKEWIDRESQEYYLDGPNDVDWIFRNDIVQSREDTIYVNYVENDGKHYWQRPEQLDDYTLDPDAPPASISLVTALRDAGCTKPEALKLIAGHWRTLSITDDLEWHTVQNANTAILEEMKKYSLLNVQPSSVYSKIVNGWLFPLYDLELREVKVKKAGLEEIRRNWWPEW
jgi:AbiV family abortive infection protein